jgi:predicted unusual protein kinase regulating ubiquinone biosynthesis (AarF/ABC1/UbiB family)
LGRRSIELYAEFDPEPIAAASLGQVYRAQAGDG